MIFHLKTNKMTPLELKLKKLYETNPSRHLDQPCDRKDIRDVLDMAFHKAYPNADPNLEVIIDEHIFISDDLDAAFVKHLRYLPAFEHKHDFFELLYVVSGHCTNTIVNQGITMTAGDICIMAPDTIHAVSAFSDNDVILNIVIRKSTFEASFFGLLEGNDILSEFFRRTFYDTAEIPYLLFHTGSNNVLPQYINRAFQEYGENKRFKKQMLNSLLSEFFIALFRHYEKTIEVPNIRMRKSDENLMYILHYMQSNFARITLKEMAEFFNYSERQLQRLILNATGMTFRENIQNQKMTKAADLLLNSSLTISQISEQLGFESFNNFRKIFHKYYQTTPSAFRKNANPK